MIINNLLQLIFLPTLSRNFLLAIYLEYGVRRDCDFLLFCNCQYLPSHSFLAFLEKCSISQFAQVLKDWKLAGTASLVLTKDVVYQQLQSKTCLIWSAQTVKTWLFSLISCSPGYHDKMCSYIWLVHFELNRPKHRCVLHLMWVGGGCLANVSWLHCRCSNCSCVSSWEMPFRGGSLIHTK